MRHIFMGFCAFFGLSCQPNFVKIAEVEKVEVQPPNSDVNDTGSIGEEEDFPSEVDDETLGLLQRLEAIDGMRVEALPTEHDGLHYKLIYTQPIAHEDPNAGDFEQHILLHHFDLDAPMVLATTGYHNYLEDHLSEPAVAFGANQIMVEQRFFGQSMPNVSDWRELTIENAAADHHRIVTQLKRIYKEKWVSTGHSKGGMTSIYHRRFYPEDVDATVAYVAPISFGAPDDRYPIFFEEVIDAQCRDKVRLFQNLAIDRFDDLYALFLVEIEGMNNSYTIAGSPTPAFEDMISGFEWFFWQYLGMTYCEYIPDQTASDAVFMEILGWQGFDNSADHRIMPFRPYYYQAYTQLGYPAGPSHLRERLNHPYQGSVLPPSVGQMSYDPAAMIDIDDWVSTDGSRILFVYGGFDPWTAGAFVPGANEQHSFTSPQGAHRTQIQDLPFDQALEAYDIIGSWLDAQPNRSPQASVSSLPIIGPRPIFWQR